MRALGGSIGLGHPLRAHMDVIENKVPSELLDRVRQHPTPDSPHADVPSEKALVRLHKQVRDRSQGSIMRWEEKSELQLQIPEQPEGYISC